MVNPLAKAGESVQRRDFLKGGRARVLIQQLHKLYEEVSEFEVSVLAGEPDPDELADIVIVCSSIATVLDVDLDVQVVDKCQRDEATRGPLHNGVPAQNLEGYVYRDFS